MADRLTQLQDVVNLVRQWSDSLPFHFINRSLFDWTVSAVFEIASWKLLQFNRYFATICQTKRVFRVRKVKTDRERILYRKRKWYQRQCGFGRCRTGRRRLCSIVRYANCSNGKRYWRIDRFVAERRKHSRTAGITFATIGGRKSGRGPKVGGNGAQRRTIAGTDTAIVARHCGSTAQNAVLRTSNGIESASSLNSYFMSICLSLIYFLFLFTFLNFKYIPYFWKVLIKKVWYEYNTMNKNH